MLDYAVHHIQRNERKIHWALVAWCCVQIWSLESDSRGLCHRWCKSWATWTDEVPQIRAWWSYPCLCENRTRTFWGEILFLITQLLPFTIHIRNSQRQNVCIPIGYIHGIGAMKNVYKFFKQLIKVENMAWNNLWWSKHIGHPRVSFSMLCFGLITLYKWCILTFSSHIYFHLFFSEKTYFWSLNCPNTMI